VELLDALKSAKVVKVLPEQNRIIYWAGNHTINVVTGQGKLVQTYSYAWAQKKAFTPKEALKEVEKVATEHIYSPYAYQRARKEGDIDWLISYIENELNYPNGVDAIFEMFKPEEGKGVKT